MAAARLWGADARLDEVPSQLQVLDLSFNDLSGPLPASMADLSSLSMLMLAGNRHLE